MNMSLSSEFEMSSRNIKVSTFELHENDSTIHEESVADSRQNDGEAKKQQNPEKKTARKFVKRIKTVFSSKSSQKSKHNFISEEQEVVISKVLTATGTASDTVGNANAGDSESVKSFNSSNLSLSSLISIVSKSKKSDQLKKMTAMADYHGKFYELVTVRLLAIEQEHGSIEQWDGQFSRESDEKRVLMKLKKTLTKLESLVIHLEVFVRIQLKYENRLNSIIFGSLFEKIQVLFGPQPNSLRDKEQVLYSKFCQAKDRLASNLVNYLIQHRAQILQGTHDTVRVENCVKILTLLTHMHGQIQLPNSNPPKLLEELTFQFLQEADKLCSVAVEECIKTLERKEVTSSIEKLTTLGNGLVQELNQKSAYWISIFEGLQINLLNLVYGVWDEQLSKLLKIILPYVRTQLKPIDTLSIDSKITNDDFILEENLYKLFQKLVEFVKIDKNHGFIKPKSMSVGNLYHQLFFPFVIQWLNMTLLKNLTRIKKCVELDFLRPITDSAQISSSAVDVSELLMKVHLDFWFELAWPIPEESYSFVVVLIKNLDRCVQHYTEVIWQRVCQVEKCEFEHYEVSDELLMALNNIDELRKHSEDIVRKLQIPDLVKTIRSRKRAPEPYQRQCSTTLPNLMKNMTEKVNQNIVDVITCAWQNNMEHMFLVLLDRCADTTTISDFKSEKTKLLSHVNRVFLRVETKLRNLESSHSLQILIWKNMMHTFERYLETCKQGNKSPLTFQHLQIILSDLENVERFSKCKNNENDQSILLLLKLKSHMRLNGSSSIDLQLEYLTIRFQEQCNMSKNAADEKSIGRLGILAEYLCSSQQLRLEILHGVLYKDISESYVKIQIILRNEKGDSSHSSRKPYLYTEVKKSKCQLFEKEFLIDIPQESWSTGGMIRFWTKSRGILRTSTVIIGEAFLPIESIAKIDSIGHTEQDEANPVIPASRSQIIKLTLTYPAKSGPKCQILDILQNRKFDKNAQQFVKKERRRFI